MRRAKAVTREMIRAAADEDDDQVRRGMVTYARAIQEAKRLRAMVALAETEPEIAIKPEALDVDPWLFNVANGTIDLRTGIIRPHERGDLITKVSPVVYDASATCATFDRFLAEAQPDPEIRAYLLRWLGYCMTGLVREHAFPINYGTGRNGKGTLVNIALHIFGDYGKQVPTELLMVARGERHPTERATLLGVRFAAAAETDEGRCLNVALVKQLTGGDPIAARFMRQDFFDFMPSHKLMLSTNHRPLIKETKDAIWSRVQLVPWAVSFKGREDTEMGDKLKGEASGVLNRLLAGCLEWQRIGLAPPRAVQAASAAYREEQDVLGDFFAERCVFEPDARVSRPRLREAYDLWCRENGERFPLSPKAFAEAVRERGAKDGWVSQQRGWIGVGLASTTAPHFAAPIFGSSRYTAPRENNMETRVVK